MQQQFLPTSDDILAQHFHTLSIDSRAHDRIPLNFHHPPGGDTGYSGGASYQYSTRSSTARHSEQYLQPPVVDTRVYPGASGNYPVDPRLAQSARNDRPRPSNVPSPLNTSTHESYNSRYPTGNQDEARNAEIARALRNYYGIQHELALRALKEPRPGERPDASLHLMASLAIFESPDKGLTFSEITQAIEYRFPILRTDTRWKESLRHSLSVQGGLRRVKKPLDKPGRGDWWIIAPEAMGHNRERKRGRSSASRGESDSEYETDSANLSHTGRNSLPLQTYSLTRPMGHYPGQSDPRMQMLPHSAPSYGTGYPGYSQMPSIPPSSSQGYGYSYGNMTGNPYPDYSRSGP